MKKEKFKHKKIMAIDYGRKHTGLATYKVDIDPYPLMYGRIEYQSDLQLIGKIIQITREEFVDFVILGIPYFTDGRASSMTKTIKEFSDKLQASPLALPLFEVDETLTSFEAKERMKSEPQFNFKIDMTKIDALSAVIMLEEFVKNFSN